MKPQPPKPTVTPAPAPTRSTYRHGDLRRALLEAGIALARDGGPDAVVLREATRRAGVVPNAAYRHFAGRAELLEAVRSAALALAAKSMEVELAKVPAHAPPVEQARACVRAVGTGYMRFALAQPGLFRTAFLPAQPVAGGNDPSKAGASGLNPFQLLGQALDRLVDAGALPPQRRPGAEYIAWSAVHGLSLLIIEGPLRGLPAAQAESLGQALLDMVERGL